MTAEPTSSRFELRHAATDRASIVVVPERRMLAIDGLGDPSGTDFRFAGETLRTVADLVRHRVAKRQGGEHPANPIECAWWTNHEPPPEDVPLAFADRSSWHWQQMIELPHLAADEDAAAAIEEVRSRAGRPVPLVRVVRFREGRSAQILHVGGPSGEAASVRRLYDALASEGLRPRGHLHEIWIADFERVPEERARSILRLPVEP